MSFNQAELKALNTILVEEATHIGDDIHRDTVHQSIWMDLIKKEQFADGQGFDRQTLIYDRALPTTDQAGDNVGVQWGSMAIRETNDTFDKSIMNQPLAGAVNTFAGADAADPAGGEAIGSETTDGTDIKSYVRFSRRLKPFSIIFLVYCSPPPW